MLLFTLKSVRRPIILIEYVLGLANTYCGNFLSLAQRLLLVMLPLQGLSVEDIFQTALEILIPY